MHMLWLAFYFHQILKKLVLAEITTPLLPYSSSWQKRVMDPGAGGFHQAGAAGCLKYRASHIETRRIRKGGLTPNGPNICFYTCSSLSDFSFWWVLQTATMSEKLEHNGKIVSHRNNTVINCNSFLLKLNTRQLRPLVLDLFIFGALMRGFLCYIIPHYICG